MSDFSLDPRLAADTTPVCMLELSELRLGNDARFPWLLLVPQRAGLAEIIELPKPERAVLFEEITRVSSALQAVTRCDKLNVAAIGNIVRQLHVHIIARFETDSAWPRPVWGYGEAVAYDVAARDKFREDILAALA